MAGELIESMEYWKEKCSICFENRCDFCLPGCEDQFCNSCIRRYFKEVVDNSWGLSGCQMKCPVCYSRLPKDVWMKHADKKTIQRYEAFNKPFRPFSRHCTSCGEEVAVAKPPASTNEGFKKMTEDIMCLIRTIIPEDDRTFELIAQDMALVLEKKRSVLDLYTSALQKLHASFSSHNYFVDPANEKKRKLNEVNNEMLTSVLARVISLEADNEKWRQLQHHHVRSFPKLRCENCSSQMCFRCGEASWHEDHTCQEYLQKKLESCDPELVQTLQWTIANGKRCPNCSILINRDDGCNKMDCLHCGHVFCWICEGPWSSDCGFYRCKTSTGEEEVVVEIDSSEGSSSSSSATSSSPPPQQSSEAEKPQAKADGPSPKKRKRPSEDAKPEIGVPNVTQIERRMSIIAQEKAQSRKGSFSPPPSTPGRRKFAKDWLPFSRLFLD